MGMTYKPKDTFIEDNEEDLEKIYQLATDEIKNFNYQLWFEESQSRNNSSISGFENPF
jgi:hypothetical protein